MKLLYQGPAPLGPLHVRRQKRRSWVKDICLEFLAALAATALIWVLIIFLFLI